MTRKPWKPLPLLARKQEAINLVEQLLTGERRSEALFWLRRRRYTPGQLENFIASMQRGLDAKAERGAG